jgi:hypothetical protein
MECGIALSVFGFNAIATESAVRVRPGVIGTDGDRPWLAENCKSFRRTAWTDGSMTVVPADAQEGEEQPPSRPRPSSIHCARCA